MTRWLKGGTRKAEEAAETEISPWIAPIIHSSHKFYLYKSRTNTLWLHNTTLISLFIQGLSRQECKLEMIYVLISCCQVCCLYSDSPFSDTDVELFSFVVKSSPDCDRNQCLCGALEPACFSWCCWPSPGPSPPTPDLASPLRRRPAPRPRGPPPGRGRATRASHGAGRPAPPPGRNTGSRLPVPEVTPGNKYMEFVLAWVYVIISLLSSWLSVNPTSQWAAPVATVKADGYVRIWAPSLCRASDNSGNLRS